MELYFIISCVWLHVFIWKIDQMLMINKTTLIYMCSTKCMCICVSIEYHVVKHIYMQITTVMVIMISISWLDLRSALLVLGTESINHCETVEHFHTQSHNPFTDKWRLLITRGRPGGALSLSSDSKLHSHSSRRGKPIYETSPCTCICGNGIYCICPVSALLWRHFKVPS